jgi:hypothetical protein
MSGASIFPRTLKPEWLLPDTGSGEKKNSWMCARHYPVLPTLGVDLPTTLSHSSLWARNFFFSSALQLPQPNPLHQSPPTQRVFLCCWKRKTTVPGSADPRQFTWASSQLKRGEKKTIPKTLLTSQHAEEGTPFFPLPLFFSAFEFIKA